MDKVNKQHVQLPNDMTLDVKPRDLLIYVTIKRHMNNTTKKSYKHENDLLREEITNLKKKEPEVFIV